MNNKEKYKRADTNKYKNRGVNEFESFSDKIICARLNFVIGKKKKRGLSLQEASKKIGITPQYLSLLERGCRLLPNPIIVYKMETVYGFLPGDLVAALMEDSGKKVIS